MIGLQIRIRLRDGEERFQSAGQGIDGHVARLHHFFQRLFLVSGVPFHRLHEIGNQIVPPFELHVDLRPRILRLHLFADQTVINGDAELNHDSYPGNRDLQVNIQHDWPTQ